LFKFNKLALLLTGILTVTFMLSGCMSFRERCTHLAKNGNSEAQAQLGSYYMIGSYGSNIDYKEAFHWLRNASANSSSLGMYYLGVIYDKGYGDVIPDRMRAARYYEINIEKIRKRAKAGDLSRIFALADMYYYGRGVKRDYKAAYKMYEYCVSKAYYPAIQMLGIIHYTGHGGKKDIEAARDLLYKASAKNYPIAMYYLSKVYTELNKPGPAVKWLQKSAQGGYPPAMYDMAVLYKNGIEVDRNDAEAKLLMMKAAQAGFAPAQFKAADYSSDKEIKFEWIKKASERGFVPAMLKLAEMMKAAVERNPAKIMALYELARKLDINNASISSEIVNFDNENGLYLPVKFCWYGVTGGESILLADSSIFRIIDGYRAGIKKGSREMFNKQLQENPCALYINNDWYLINTSGLPLQWAGDIFKTLHETESKKPGFWLSYAIAAGLAGQGGIQAYAAYKLKQIVAKISDKEDRRILADLAALLKANSLMLLNREDEAYTALFNNGRLNYPASPYIINFVNFWCAPLLKNPKKFSVASGIDAKKLGQYCFPFRNDFYDLQYNREVKKQPEVAEPEILFKKK
jgi:TPR repeat protein